ncbi:ornithine decarboxylase [Jatrophihabitans sp. GAS493]|uniref:type III PLP-dependent enzyme n=1 Tax=Jatrophihabitans sp. GAS493 TaxID=1907575 RepID=UPI000BB74E52|nr:type III PLP-dependent enzyme [Jatrophihabitans sp. GAS493]SOD71252.1 ornithine decarboxylase [Jatrophihabitans sp. GAS493]
MYSTNELPLLADLSATGSVSARADDFIAANPALPTPFLVVDLDVVADRYRQLNTALPSTSIFFAVKANPAPEVVALLVGLGSSFDVASPGEIDLCLDLGADPSRLSYGNTIKKERDIAYAASRGIRIFTVDSSAELEKVITQLESVTGAVQGTVYIRIVTDGAGADWPLSRKFGCSVQEAWPLMLRAAESGLGVGVSFHVGSQQRNPQAWDQPLCEVAELFRQLRARGFTPAGINLGGGLPSVYTDPTPEVQAYGAAINSALARHFGREDAYFTIIEPGRYLVGDAGVIQAEVVLITERDSDPGRRWIYLDLGMFNGLTEALGEAIRYRLRHPATDAGCGPVVLAGPSCDSADVLYETYEYQLPLDLKIGDRIEFLSTGAYTSSYSSVWFNGFTPLVSHYLPASISPAPTYPVSAPVQPR